MTLVFIIYLVQVVFPSLSVVLGIACAVSGLFMLISLVVHYADKDVNDHKDDYKPAAIWGTKKRYWVCVFLFGLLSNLIPDKETSYVLLAAYGVETIATNEKVQELGGKSLEVLEKAMDGYLKENLESIETSEEE